MEFQFRIEFYSILLVKRLAYCLRPLQPPVIFNGVLNIGNTCHVQIFTIAILVWFVGSLVAFCIRSIRMNTV